MKPISIVLTLWLGVLVRLPAVDFEFSSTAELRKIIPASSKVERIASGFFFLQGPVWIPATNGAYLVFSDIAGNELKAYTRFSGVTIYRKPSNHANGNAIDLEGRLVTAEHDGRRLTITAKDGQVKALVDQCDGKKFNSPSDLVVKSDGTVWFCDPTFGLGTRPKEQPGNYVFRFDPKTSQTVPMVKECEMPNGLCFSPDEKKLYVADAGKVHHVLVFDVEKGGRISAGKEFCSIEDGSPNGIRCDAEGRVWSTVGRGVHIYAPDGTLIGRVLVPETPSNLTFGGPDGKMLFITARKSLYAVQLSVAGAPRPGKSSE